MRKQIFLVYLFLRRIVVWLILGGLLIYVGCYIFVGIKGEAFFEQKLAGVFHRPVKIAQVQILFPLIVRLEELNIQDLLRAKRLEIDWGLPDLMQREIRLRRVFLWEPFLAWDKAKLKSSFFSEAGFPMRELSEEQIHLEIPHEDTDRQKPWPFHLRVEQLILQKGQIQIYDSQLPGDFETLLGEVQLKALNVVYPLINENMQFDIQATYFKPDFPFSGSHLVTKGWINFIDKGMNGMMRFFDEGNRDILTLHLSSIDNDMTVQGRCNLETLAKLPFTMGGRPLHESAIAQETVTAGILSAAAQVGQKLFLDSPYAVPVTFSFQTRMDDFRIDAISFSGQVQTHIEAK